MIAPRRKSSPKTTPRRADTQRTPCSQPTPNKDNTADTTSGNDVGGMVPELEPDTIRTLTHFFQLLDSLRRKAGKGEAA